MKKLNQIIHKNLEIEGFNDEVKENSVGKIWNFVMNQPEAII
jgi:hypothetical protein